MTSNTETTAEQPTEAKSEAAPKGPDTMAGLLDEFVPTKALRRGEIIDGKVMSKSGEGILVSIGYKSEGFVPVKEMR